MKKVLLFLAIALFLSAGVVTATKIQSANAGTGELAVSNADLNSVAPFADGDEKDKKKDSKSEKCVKENCSKENCKKENCKDTCDKGEKSVKGDVKCNKEAKSCCSKDKGKK